jgi:cytoplasmic iron level regulating protein YaaA (DUF328/UPF0246 family)
VLILLPPSEGTAAPTRGSALRPESLSFPALQRPREAMLDALVSVCTTDGAGAAEALGLGPTQAGEVERDAALRTAPTARAERIYSGVLYEALDLGSLDRSARGRAARWLAVTSGLFGLLRVTDKIPAYRLSGGVSLPGTGPVAGFWARHLDPVVTEAAGSGLVVDLRSSTYASFWRPTPAVRERVVTLRVLHEVNGTRKVVSHFNKATKGRLVRDLLVAGEAPKDAARFADHLLALGWKVEAEGTRLDVVVTDL